jgi:hypothetical protein
MHGCFRGEIFGIVNPITLNIVLTGWPASVYLNHHRAYQ